MILKVSVAAPRIVLPCLHAGLGGDANSMLVMKLGNITVDTVASKADASDRYLVVLDSVNMYLCSDGESWQDPQHALFSLPISAKLEIDKPSPKNPLLEVAVHVCSIDLILTKVQVLHAFALLDTLKSILPTSEMDNIRRKKKQQQLQVQINRCACGYLS